jgi:hypothetical protein
MWTDVIGLAQTPDAGSNAAVEAHIKVPGRVGGAGVNVGVRRRRGAISEDDAVVRPTEALVALARIQAARGAVVEGDRGVCRRCGFAGHLASQCKSEYVMLRDDGEGAQLAPDDEPRTEAERRRKRKRKKEKKKRKKSDKRKKKQKEKDRKREKKRKRRRRDSSSDTDSDSDSSSSSSTSSSSSES